MSEARVSNYIFTLKGIVEELEVDFDRAGKGDIERFIATRKSVKIKPL